MVCIVTISVCRHIWISPLPPSSKDLGCRMEWKSRLAHSWGSPWTGGRGNRHRRKKRPHYHSKAGIPVLCHRFLLKQAKRWLYRGTCWLRETHEMKQQKKSSSLVGDLSPVLSFVYFLKILCHPLVQPVGMLPGSHWSRGRLEDEWPLCLSKKRHQLQSGSCWPSCGVAPSTPGACGLPSGWGEKSIRVESLEENIIPFPSGITFLQRSGGSCSNIAKGFHFCFVGLFLWFWVFFPPSNYFSLTNFCRGFLKK